jgi:hypothetical protein
MGFYPPAISSAIYRPPPQISISRGIFQIPVRVLGRNFSARQFQINIHLFFKYLKWQIFNNRQPVFPDNWKKTYNLGISPFLGKYENGSKYLCLPSGFINSLYVGIIYKYQ